MNKKGCDRGVTWNIILVLFAWSSKGNLEKFQLGKTLLACIVYCNDMLLIMCFRFKSKWWKAPDVAMETVQTCHRLQYSKENGRCVLHAWSVWWFKYYELPSTGHVQQISTWPQGNHIPFKWDSVWRYEMSFFFLTYSSIYFYLILSDLRSSKEEAEKGNGILFFPHFKNEIFLYFFWT